MLADNLKIIQARWPHLVERLQQDSEQYSVHIQQGQDTTLLVNDIQLTGAYDRQAEACLLANQIPENIKQVVLYGPALGDVQRQLLARGALEKLLIQILNPSVFRYVLQSFDQSDWLADPRVELFYDPKQQQVYSPFIAQTGELLLASDKMATLRDRIALELNHDYLMHEHQADDPKVKQRFRENQSFIEQDAGGAELLAAIQSRRAWVVAAGPSLEATIHLLLSARKQDDLLISVDSSIKYLLAQEIVPDIVVSTDSTADELFKESDYSKLVNSKLVYFPRVPSCLLQKWQGPRFCTYSTGALYDQLASSNTRPRLYSAGSVLHTAVDFAVQSGAKELVLLGADFSFFGTSTHAGGNIDEGLHLSIEDTGHYLLNGEGNRVPTWANFKGYLRDLEHYIQSHKHIQFINTSKKGAQIAGTQYWEELNE